jgi:hypothetical protein
LVSFLLGKFKLYLLGALGILTTVLAIFFKGVSHQKNKEKVKDLEDYKETTEELSSVEDISSVSDANKYLRERNKS